MKKNNMIIDASGMRQVIVDFPQQFRAGIFAAEEAHLPAMRLRSPIVLCGMGGSASVGDLLRLWMRHEYMGVSQFEIVTHRSYGLPKLEKKEFAGGTWEPLVVTISYSGNTEETLSAYDTAREKRLPVVAMSVGGKLKEKALKDEVPFIQIPDTGIQPRSSLGIQFGALVALLINLGVAENRKREVANLGIALKTTAFEKEGKRLASKYIDATPLVYASDAWKELARIIKIKFNEHAKIPAFWNYFPELNHNEFTGFAAKVGGTFRMLVLQDEFDHPRNKKRMALTAAMLAKKGIKSDILVLKGKTALEKMFNALALGDWIAYYTAVKRGIDPTPVVMVEEFKKSMK